MNSDPNESKKRPKEASEQGNESADGSSSLKKFHGIGPNEHAKPRRRGRRGKKRKQRKSGGAVCGSEPHEECKVENPAECEKHCMSWDSDEEDIEVEDYNLLGDVMIRPTDVPKAPENSTTFIIDDHDECWLYKNFATHDFLRPPQENSEIIEPEGEDAAYVDINYEYESPHDFDNSAYYDREFDRDYKNNRYEELLRLAREELITGLRSLQDHLQELHQDLVKEDPDPILEKLQTELLEQQEKHSQLKEENSRLCNRLEEAGVDYLEEQSVSQIAGEELIKESEHCADTSEEHILDASEQFLEDCIENRCENEELSENVDSAYGYLQCSEESLSKQSALSEYNQKESSQSPCHIPHMDASNKENSCYDEVVYEERSAKCTPRHESCNDSCTVKGILRDSECCEEMSTEELNVVTV